MPPLKSTHVHFDGNKIRNKLVAKRIGFLLLAIGVAYIAGICYKTVSNYNIVDNCAKKRIPTYKVNGYVCFKATVTFKVVTKKLCSCTGCLYANGRQSDEMKVGHSHDC